jgi:hypothetical protein
MRRIAVVFQVVVDVAARLLVALRVRADEGRELHEAGVHAAHEPCVWQRLVADPVLLEPGPRRRARVGHVRHWRIPQRDQTRGGLLPALQEWVAAAEAEPDDIDELKAAF